MDTVICQVSSDISLMKWSAAEWNLADIECAAELNINLVYLPPYSPNLNLIERLWKFMRSKVLANKYYNSFKCFFDKVHDFLSSAYIEYSSALNSLLALNFQCFDSNCCIN